MVSGSKGSSGRLSLFPWLVNIFIDRIGARSGDAFFTAMYD